MQTYFSEYDKFHSYFITPKTSPTLRKEIERLISEANQLIQDDAISIKYATDEAFYSDFVAPLLIASDTENDTSELFLRATKLLALDKQNPPKKQQKAITKVPKTINGMKIGQFVQYVFRELYRENKITPQELKNLQTKDYAKRTFNMGSEILRDRTQPISDHKGNKRYYVNPEFFGTYYLNSQWFDKHWDSLLKWLDKVDYKY